MSENNEPAVREEPKPKYNVRMLKTQQGSEDGIHVNSYKEGHSYSIGQDLYNAFVTEGIVQLISDDEAALIADEAEKAKQKLIDDNAAAEKKAAEDAVNLVGSEFQPAEITCPNGDVVKIGDVVGMAFRESGLDTKQAWNDLTADQREAYIQAEVEKLQGKIGSDTEVKSDNPATETGQDPALENKTDNPPAPELTEEEKVAAAAKAAEGNPSDENKTA